ncbi:MAG: Gfo/Idh/MocA family oxidoreductase [Verrucomicrobia bacterium]|jgi:myo-inositol 2-dehydrogenase/D-chiro-inositol 1-dehydrogenase|nr:Gfo/Idh/MocA family oxidoreductase [Verrucomicrobiota bacterium]
MNGDSCGRVRIGFIGCGAHASQNLYPSLRFADGDLVAAADPMEERRLYVKRYFGAGRVYESYEAMLGKEALDAVIVCGPPSLYEEAGLAALGRKLPVLVEKPPAESLEGCKRLRRAAVAAGKPLMVAMMKRFSQKYEISNAQGRSATPEPVNPSPFRNEDSPVSRAAGHVASRPARRVQAPEVRGMGRTSFFISAWRKRCRTAAFSAA